MQKLRFLPNHLFHVYSGESESESDSEESESESGWGETASEVGVGWGVLTYVGYWGVSAFGSG